MRCFVVIVLQGWRPEWQRLGERVATIVNNDEHPVGNCFQIFCREIIEKCQCVIDMGKSDSQKSRTSTISCSPFGRMDVGQDASYELTNIGFEDFVSNFFKNELEKISCDISEHLARATELLADQFNHWESYFKNKLRLCYEQCFFNKTHCFVECVYELAHHSHVEEMESDVKRLRKLPIKLLDLQMKDEWWLELFDQRGRLESGNQRNVLAERERINDTVNGYAGLLGSYDMIDELTDDELSDSSILSCSANHNHVHMPVSINDVDNIRSLAISAIRERSRTFNGLVDNSDCQRVQHHVQVSEEDSDLSRSAPNPHPSLGDIMDRWENSEMSEQPIRRHSKSQNNIARQRRSETGSNNTSHSADTFQEHFGPALQNMRDILRVTSPLAKLKCLTASLKKVTSKVSELRQKDGQDQFKAAVTAEDLLPLLVLMLLQLEPWETAVMWPQLQLIEDLMAPCLRSGCHGWALAQFQLALRFLSRLCHEF